MRLISIIYLFLITNIIFAAQLTVTTEGKGFVKSTSHSGIECGYACTADYDAGTQVSLIAKPNEGLSFIEWGGACSGSELTCTVSLDSDKEVIAKFSGEVLKEYQLTVYKSGNGQGKVQSDPYGIGLGIIAPYDSAPFPAGSEVVLTAMPLEGSIFGGWSGACTGTQEICSIVIDSKKEVTASFVIEGEPTPEPTLIPPTPQPVPQPPPASIPGTIDTTNAKGLSLTVSKIGSGAVASKDQKIVCGSTCMANYELGTTVTLTTAASSGYTFMGWEGNCKTKEPICIVYMSKQKTARALFFPSLNQLTVSKIGDGHVTSSDYKIFCGPYCIGDYLGHATVTLTAIPSIGSTFNGWGGVCSGKSTTCVVTINSSTNVTASFETPKPIEYNLSVSVSNKELGVVISSDKIIDCGNNCSSAYEEGETITLTASKLKVYADAHKTALAFIPVFDGWGGACVGKNLTCTVTMDASKQVVANFRKPRERYNLSINMAGEGSGTVSAYGAQICPGDCSRMSLPGDPVPLQAIPDDGSIFGGWEGQCNAYSTSDANHCTVSHSSDEDTNITVIFNKDPNPPKNYRLNISKSGTGKGEVTVSYNNGNSYFICGMSETTCYQKFPRDEKLTLTAKPDLGYTYESYVGSTYMGPVTVLGSRFKGWEGACTGLTETCNLTMDSLKRVTAKFSQSVFYNITVVNEAETITIRTYDQIYYYGYTTTGSKISCGNSCTAEYESESVVKLQSSKDVKWTGCDSVLEKTCVVNLESNRIISVDLTDADKIQLVKQALVEYFTSGEYAQYDLFSYVQNEQNLPFQHTLEALMKKEMKNNVASIKNWIEQNKAWFLNQGGIQATINQIMKDIVIRVLTDVFANEIAQYPALKDFLYDESKKPFQTAMVDLKANRNGGGFNGLRSWIQGAKDWYLSATGINDKIEELKPKPPPPPPPPPSITSIEPQGRQIGKPTVVKGTNFINVQRVTVGSDVVSYNLISENEIVLPYVAWGMGSNPTVTVETNGWKTWAPLIYNNGETVIYNANGGTEECFGGVGKGCGGLTGGNVLGGSSRILFTRAGCESEEDGYRKCWVAPGSLRHDNCCVRNPGGRYCGGPGTDGKPAEDKNHNGMCSWEWDTAVSDVFWFRAWEQWFRVAGYSPDLTPASSSPFGRYNQGEAVTTTGVCAASGHELRDIEDFRFCCSGSAYISNKKCV